MLRRLWLLAALAASILTTVRAGAEEALPPASRLIPQDAVLAVELSKPKQLLDVALGEKTLQAVASSPVYQKATDNAKFREFQQIVRYLEVRLGCDWKTSLQKLVGGGVTWAVTADGGSLFIVDAEDAKLLGQLHDIILEFAKGEAAKAATPRDMASADYRGVKSWSFAENEAHAVVGNRFLLANRRDLLKQALDLQAGEGKGLEAADAYQQAKRAAGNDGAATVYVNLSALKRHPKLEKALSEDENPMAALLMAGMREALRESNWLAMKLRVDDKGLSLAAKTDALAKEGSQQTAFAWPKLPDEGALPNLTVPRQIAGLSLYRDLHSFYAEKDKLFPERTSGLIFFENMMGIFFSGRELTEDVMAQPKPEVRVVVARQKFASDNGVPQLQLPAFATVFRLKDPKKYGDVAEAAWQKALGLVNFTRGQKAQPGLIIDKLTHNDTRYTLAYFQAPEEENVPLTMDYNFRPTLVKLEDYLVLSSTDGLACDVIDAIKKEIAAKGKPRRGVHSLLEFNAVELSAILDVNRQGMVRQNMVEKGNSQEQADNEIGLLTTLVGYLGELKLTLGLDKNGQQSATLDMKPSFLQ